MIKCVNNENIKSGNQGTRSSKWWAEDWPDGIITVASYITDAQVIHHHKNKVGLPALHYPCDITHCQQEQGHKGLYQQMGP